jgi:5-formaminoimidazole-4-carboxamide-1-(beta)-D-ribofuranosyl 5'-monophosphate synthetase
MDSQKLLEGYDLEKLSIASLGGHSALETSLGAKKQGLKSVVVAKRGREKTYSDFLKFDPKTETGAVDEVILVDEFSDILKPEIQKQLRKLNVLFVHSRYFWVYFDDFAKVENEFEVPILGTRELLRLEERDQKPNQYEVLEKAGIRIPKIYKIPKFEVVQELPEEVKEYVKQTNADESKHLKPKVKFIYDGHTMSREELKEELENFIGGITLTKVNNATRRYERENFLAKDWEDWAEIASKKLARGDVTEEDLRKATVEEFVLGAQINFNFFYSPLSDRLELLGTDTRRQTSLDGFLRLPAKQQLDLEKKGIQPSHIETGHIAATVKESLLEKAFEAGSKFVETCKKYNPRGMIGPFALQGAIETDGKKEELVVFDVSFRVPGSPGMAATPYSSYLFGRPVAMGERIAMEVNAARMSGRLGEIVS